MTMIEGVKLLVGVIVALMESIPQTNPTGTIPDAEYNAMLSDAVAGLATGAGFQITGFTDAQIRGAALALIAVVSRWQKATRV